jgi:hypothetical protein
MVAQPLSALCRLCCDEQRVAEWLSTSSAASGVSRAGDAPVFNRVRIAFVSRQIERSRNSQSVMPGTLSDTPDDAGVHCPVSIRGDQPYHGGGQQTRPVNPARNPVASTTAQGAHRFR